MRTRYMLLAVTLSVVLALGPPSLAKGAVVINIVDTAQGAVATGNGTINTTALTLLTEDDMERAGVQPYTGLFIAGPAAETPAALYSGISGPLKLGSGIINGGGLGAASGSGAILGVSGASTKYLTLPSGYISGGQLSDTSLFFEDTISEIGLADGTYIYTWGSGPTADSLTINIGTPVPEPASVAVIAVPATLALLRRRRPRKLV